MLLKKKKINKCRYLALIKLIINKNVLINFILQIYKFIKYIDRYRLIYTKKNVQVYEL